MSGCWGGEVNGKREEGGFVCVDGAWFTMGSSLLVVGCETNSRNRRIFFAISFHFIQVCTPVPNGTFLFRGFHPVLESQQIVSISDGQVSC